MSLIDAALIVSGVAFLASMVRLGIGPTLADRAVATDVCLFSLVGSLALLSIRLEAPVFLDLVVVATLLGFVATLSLAHLLSRRDR